MLNTKRLRTRTTPVSIPVEPTRSSSVSLERLDRVDRLAGNGESHLEVMNSIENQAPTKKHVSSEVNK